MRGEQAQGHDEGRGHENEHAEEPHGYTHVAEFFEFGERSQLQPTTVWELHGVQVRFDRFIFEELTCNDDMRL
jgi:hypothetical protein